MINELRDVTEINGKKICVMDDLRELYPEKFNESGAMDYKWFESEIRPNFNIFLRHDVDSISFNMLSKPANEGGDLNRCQFNDLIETARLMLVYLNNKFPCRENAMTLTKLDEALMWNNLRTENRIKRNIEGKNER